MIPRQVVVAGQPGAGKSLLVARLAPYLGPPRPGGRGDACGGLPVSAISLRDGRTLHPLDLIDTPGLTETPAPDPALRRAQALALERMLAAAAVLHVVDAPRLGARDWLQLGRVDAELLEWGRGRDGYLLLANKLDLPFGQTGWEWLRRAVAGPPVLAVSARTGLGFGAVRQVLRGRGARASS